MSSPLWAVWLVQGGTEKNQFEYFLAAFEAGFFNFSGANLNFLLNIAASVLKSCLVARLICTLRIDLKGTL